MNLRELIRSYKFIVTVAGPVAARRWLRSGGGVSPGVQAYIVARYSKRTSKQEPAPPGSLIDIIA